MSDDKASIATLEANQKNLTQSVNQLSNNIDRFIESNYRLENKIDNLEIRALNRLDTVEAKVESACDDLKKTKAEIYGMQLAYANEQGQKEVKVEIKSILWNNWFKLFSLVCVIIPIVVGVYNLMSEAPNKNTKQTKELKK